MKKVFKSVLVAAVLVAATVSANAQVSINAGYVSTTPISNSESGDAIKGITAGLGYDMNVQGGVGLSWGLNYTYAWDKEEDTQNIPFLGSITFSGKSADHYLDVPVRLTYTLPLSGDLNVFGFAGPKFVYAIAGKTTTSVSTDLAGDISEYIPEIPEGNKDHYKDTNLSRFDIKAGLGAGVQFKNIILKAGYDWGLLNQYTGNNDNYSAKSNHFYATLGFAF